MVAQKSISIAFPANRDGALTHRIRNLGEDLWRDIEKDGLGDLGGLSTIDSAREKLTIRIKLSRNINRVRRIVAKRLDDHRLATDAKVTYS